MCFAILFLGKLLFIAIFITCFSILSFSIAIADKNNERQTFLEADYVKKSEDNLFANGHVILRRSEMLVNTDEIECHKSNIKPGLDDKKNITDNDKYRFFARNWLKLRTDDDNIVFAKSMFYDENNKTGFIKNAQIYPAQNEHAELYATKLKKKNDLFIMDDVSICPCKLFLDKNVNENREVAFSEITSDKELLNKPIEKNAIDNTDDEMKQKMRHTLISFSAKKMSYFETEHMANFKHLQIRLLGVPIFYWPSYSFHTDDTGDSGFLLPQIASIGKRQVGIEIPLYLKIRPNIDLLLSRTQYFDITEPKKKKNSNAYALKDLSRYRESSTQFRFRHLISTNNAYENFYRFETTIIDKTQLVDNATGLGRIDSNNKKIMGYRWMFDFRTRIKFTKTTFLKVDLNLASDKKLMYYYKFDSRKIQENNIHLYDVAENRYLSAEVFNYQSRLMYINSKTNPIVFPVIRGEFDFKKDKIGGNFYIRGKTFYINRNEGYSVFTTGFDFGYHLPFYAKSGTKITFDTIMRGIGNNVNYSYYTPSNGSNQYNEYNNIINNRYYVSANYRHNQITALSFSKIQAEHSVIIESIFGKTIINPKIAFRVSPNGNRKLSVPVEDNLAMQMTYHSAFDLTQSDGFGIYDSGYSIVHGFDFKHQIKKKLELFGGVAQNIRLSSSLNEELLAEYTGFRKTMSDIMSHFGAKVYNISANGFLNYDIYNKEPRMLGVDVSYNNKYLYLSISYNSLSRNATLLGIQTSLITLNAKINPTQKLKLIASAAYNFKGQQVRRNAYKSPGFTFYTFGAYYTISCLSVGLVVSRTNFTIDNTPSDTIIRIKFSFAGFG